MKCQNLHGPMRCQNLHEPLPFQNLHEHMRCQNLREPLWSTWHAQYQNLHDLYDVKIYMNLYVVRIYMGLYVVEIYMNLYFRLQQTFSLSMAKWNCQQRIYISRYSTINTLHQMYTKSTNLYIKQGRRKLFLHSHCSKNKYCRNIQYVYEISAY